jgi:hypothetical protein
LSDTPLRPASQQLVTRRVRLRSRFPQRWNSSRLPATRSTLSC